MGASGSVPTGDEGKLGDTDLNRLPLGVAHMGAIKEMEYEIGTEKYWKHMAETVGKPVQEVKAYWETTTAYIKYYNHFDTPRKEDDPEREEEEEKAEEKEEKAKEEDGATKEY